ncbi:MAG: ferredoxin:protochlorophyllide reductase (ATP-dependent) subunit B, partial [Cyanobium sp.]
VQDVPARYSPQMGWEGANVIFDAWVHPLMMGLEEHLIGMFRHDFEFVDGHRSHLGDGAPAPSPGADAAREVAVATSAGQVSPGLREKAAEAASAGAGAVVAVAEAPVSAGELMWTADGEAELHKIPFFVRGKVRRNTETFARERGLSAITSETLYDAKAHFSR